jgi:hypothetical protein
MVPAAFSRVALHCIAPKTYTRFTRWLQRHNTKLTSLMQLSLSADFSRFAWGGPSQPSHLEQLPCPQLRQLRLQNMCAQFEPAGKYKGLLHACSGLTALGLQDCRVPDIHAAMAVITALPALQHLEVQHLLEGQRFHFRGKAGSCFREVQCPERFTHLGLDCTANTDLEQLRQLTAFVNLKHLGLTGLGVGVPSGLPWQLVQLTSLRIHYATVHIKAPRAAEQLGHLSMLTALRQLSLKFDDGWNRWPVGHLKLGDLSGIQNLSQLTSLNLHSKSSHAAPPLLALLPTC